MKYPGIEYTKVEPNHLNLAEDFFENYNNSPLKFVEFSSDEENVQHELNILNVSHRISHLKLNEDGDLEISFYFMNTPKGFQLMKYFTDVDYTFKPMVVYVEGEPTKISRFILNQRRK